MAVKIGIIAGSLREGSYNAKLANLAAEDARTLGADVTAIDLAEFDLPIYHHAIETDAFPDAALRLKETLKAQDALLIASPEYNGSIPGLLKNTIDWASRPTDGEGLVALSAFRDKAAGIMSASISPFGGLRGLAHLRQILSTIQMVVHPAQVSVPVAHQAFDGDRLVDDLPRQLLADMVGKVAAMAEGLRASN
ncbi:NADPH-dependent FMN reductase [uncultured Parasphingopyxis sp.]|uniref:NADPH-dependent FMN reductase n=1 Tax=uncultured Parasphingopyxis sp. TaxID=1547918 RepID=UPI00261B5CDF|nr:NAD(P)H-dependent oxidoreductase [uncultured Parasphingopyxis sp.]